jgi:undecaprenyl-diphosphatase
MPEWLANILLGMIEGFTEFLPVSSTGHLVMAEHWLGTRSQFFNVVIQSGAVLAVLAVFYDRVKELLLHWRKPENLDYILKLALSFGLTGAGGLILKKAGLKLAVDPVPVAWATLIGGFLFLLIEHLLRNHKPAERITWAVAVAVAGAQLLAAVFPGTSRSGAAIFAALALGVSRPAAAEFAFLVGIPTLLAAGAKEAWDVRNSPEAHEPWPMILLACAVAAVSAFVVVKWLLGYVRNHRFTGFAIYRILLGTAILLFASR